MNETTYPVEPWELRAYVEEDPSRVYRVADPEHCIFGRYCNERLDGKWMQANTILYRLYGTAADEVGYPVPPWARNLIEAFDTTPSRSAVTGKDILEADILPRGDA